MAKEKKEQKSGIEPLPLKSNYSDEQREMASKLNEVISALNDQTEKE